MRYVMLSNLLKATERSRSYANAPAWCEHPASSFTGGEVLWKVLPSLTHQPNWRAFRLLGGKRT